VINALHASHKDTGWTECSARVGTKIVNKHSNASITLLPGVADRIPVMLFAGDQDVICNYVGQEMLLEKMKWRGAVGMQVRAQVIMDLFHKLMHGIRMPQHCNGQSTAQQRVHGKLPGMLPMLRCALSLYNSTPIIKMHRSSKRLTWSDLMCHK
jgi:hypothetical protein